MLPDFQWIHADRRLMYPYSTALAEVEAMNSLAAYWICLISVEFQ